MNQYTNWKRIADQFRVASTYAYEDKQPGGGVRGLGSSRIHDRLVHPHHMRCMDQRFGFLKIKFILNSNVAWATCSPVFFQISFF
jgi:hypothetical protein